MIACSGGVISKGSEGFTEHLLQDGYEYAWGVVAGDLNGDGKPEITSADAVKGNLSYFSRQEDGTFTRVFIRQQELGWPEKHDIGDVDGDGKPDVVVVMNLSKELVWYKNPGTLSQPQPWTRNVIAADEHRYYDVIFSDFNADGRLDAATSTYKTDISAKTRFAWFENPGNSGASWDVHVLDENLAGTRTIRAADFNGDSRPDLLGTANTSNLVVWYENPGQPDSQQWKRHVIDGSSLGPVHGEPIDMNADGRQDVVMAFGFLSAGPGHVAWFENVGKPGAEPTWKKHYVGPLATAFDVVAGDLTGDGKPDMVATAFGPNGQIVWFENPGDPTEQWTKHVLKENWPMANTMSLVDLDGDGRLDIVAAAERGSNEVRWWHNDMPPVAEPKTSCLLGIGGLVLGLPFVRASAQAKLKRRR
ncbi:MAG: VCBS repeat-containing protein [Pirellulales bacterium]|nr:VCBS repeat-containing protein [Pirellulales bacterium]